ncbi:MAG: iron chelate uptake ABC transporter family permease subunit [Candidatus Marinimicrobia bacterium]|nr:iron chelate uptake ABC transporter family permease subunit [Candidatus Neomarinimicrobiota bacterium]
MIEILQYEFMRNALLAAVLVSIAGGIVGTMVVVKRIVFISGGISHTAFGGLGLGYLIGVNPIITAIPFSLLSALGISVARKYTRISEDSAIGILWSVGMALGILFVELAPGYAPDLMSYLFGSILTVTTTDIFIMIVLDLIILGLVFFFYSQFQAVCFDEEFAEISGISVRFFYSLLLCMVALSVIILIRVVGIILIIALLTIPPIIARQFVKRLRPLMLWSVIISAVFTIAGLFLSYFFDLPSGATIVLTLTVAFLVSAGIKKLSASAV